MKELYIKIGCILFFILILFTGFFAELWAQSSSSYKILKSVLDQAGNTSQSSGYVITDASGQPSPIGVSTSTNYIESSGFLGGGVLSTGVEDKRDGQSPETFKLFQNYPNPFNPSTTIHYTLPFTAHVVLVIYDLSGREVRRLFDDVASEGSYTIEWDGRDLTGRSVASGVYIYKIVVKSTDRSRRSFVDVRKMIFMK